MGRTKELAKNTTILFIARFSSQVATFFLLPLYTNKLSTEEYGIIDIISTIVSVSLPIITIQIEMGVFRYFILAKDDEEKSGIITTGAASMLISSLLFSIIFLLLYGRFGIGFTYFVWGSIFIHGINSFLLQVARAQGNNAVFGIASAIISITTTILGIVFVGLYNYGVHGYLVGVIIAQAIGTLILLYKTRVIKFIDYKRYDKGILKTLSQYSIPLIFNQLSSWVVNFSDRMIILAVLGTGMNGIYSAANKLAAITNGVMSVFNLAWTENVIRNLKDRDNHEYICRCMIIFANAIFLASGAIICILPFFYNILIGKAFWDSYAHVPILLVAMAFSGMAAFIGSIFVAVGDSKIVAVTTFISALINIIINISIIRQIGLFAASISTLITFIVLFLVRLYFVRRTIQLKFSVRELISVVLMLCLLAASWITYITRNKPILLALLALHLFVFLYQAMNIARKRKTG